MLSKSDSFFRLTEMGCCSCLGFISKPIRSLSRLRLVLSSHTRSEERLLDDETEYEDSFYNGEATDILNGSDGELRSPVKRSEEIILFRIQSGKICREVPVKETRQVVRSEDENGNKMVNEYVREFKIGSGSYGKVVLYRSTRDGKQYAIKAFHKSHLLKLRVAPSETAMTDVLREVLIMKMLNHPNIVNLIEVIDDPNTDQFYMVLEYVEGKWAPEGTGPSGGLGESTVRKYLRDIVAGLMYLHAHNIVHGDIKPDNLLVTSTGVVKIGDFSVSQVFEPIYGMVWAWMSEIITKSNNSERMILVEALIKYKDDNDELRRSPGTPVFTAPECCLGLTYHGKAADTWALGVTLYCMVLGEYPFLGDTLQDTYDKIVNNPIFIPDGVNSQLKNLMEGILCKDPEHRLTLNAIAEHPWVVGEEGPIPQHLCRC